MVSLTQTDKKGKAHKAELIDSVRAHAEEFAFLWIFDVEHMRNNILQEVRTSWKGSRSVAIFKRRARAEHRVACSWAETPSCAKRSARPGRMSVVLESTKLPTFVSPSLDCD